MSQPRCSSAEKPQLIKNRIFKATFRLAGACADYHPVDNLDTPTAGPRAIG
jgi:hypothetical protein